MNHIPTAFFILLLALGGCAFSRGSLGDEINTDAVSTIKKGVTSKGEVLSLLGAPDRVLQINGRDLYQYYRYDAKAGSLLLILINFSRLSVRSDDLFVLLSREGVVEDVLFSKRTEGMEFRFWPFGD